MIYVDWVFVLFTALLFFSFFLFWFSPWGIGFIREKLKKGKIPFYLYQAIFVFLFSLILCYGIAFIEGFFKVVNFRDGLFLGIFLYLFLVFPILFLNQLVDHSEKKLFWYDQIFYFSSLALTSAFLAG